MVDSLCRPASASDSAWRTISDAARGSRRLRDEQGRTVEAIAADGRQWRYSRQANGDLWRIDADDGFFLAIDAAADGLRVDSGAGATTLRVGRDGRRRSLSHAGATLDIRLDRQGRLSRVRLPGSSRVLRYDWDGQGGCRIAPAGGETLLHISVDGATRRIEIAPGFGWCETPRPLALTLACFTPAGGAAPTLDIALDALARPISRHWHGGGDELHETFARDAQGRLTHWRRRDAGDRTLDERRWHYRDEQLVGETTPAGEWTREVDAGGRVLRLYGPQGRCIEYTYDAAGRRSRRQDGAAVTGYRYDAFGQLCAVTTPTTTLRYTWDGIGRRVRAECDGERWHEHRDEAGRLWAVTDERGAARATFIWFGDRLLARLAGPLGSPLAEGYLCDPLGTLLACLRPATATIDIVQAPPFGEVGARWQPTLYGHGGEPASGLIHCGAREYDPELGLFLTPDPWHGDGDDPRRLAGVGAAELQRQRELPARGVHPYALCQFDPVGRVDEDGHFSGWYVPLYLLRWALLPTWGFPLTAVSVFFFLPINLYFEIIGLIVWLCKQCADDSSHPWGNHTIVKAQWLLGSVRQFTFALGLNGFLPRVVSGGGPASDRAVTIGNVIWINREELSRMGRPTLLALWDIGGPPGGGGNRFNELANKESLLGITGSSDGKKRFHGSHWTRAFGNAVSGVGAAERFIDQPIAGEAFARGIAVLRKALPSDFADPDDDDFAADDDSLSVREYLFDPASDKSSFCDAVGETWFALRLPASTRLAADQWLQISAPKAKPAPDPVFRRIVQVLPASDHAAVLLRHELPASFSGASLNEHLRLERWQEAVPPATSEGWTLVAGAPAPARPTLNVALPGAGAPPAWWPPLLRKGEPVLAVAAAAAVVPPPPGVAAGASDDTHLVRVEQILVSVQLKSAAGAPALAGDVFLQRADDAAFVGLVGDPAKPREIKLVGAHPTLKPGDRLRVWRTTKPAEVAWLTVAGTVNDKLLLTADLKPALTLGPTTAVTLQRYVDSHSDKGVLRAASGDELQLEVERSETFTAERLLSYDLAGQRVLREIKQLKSVRIETGEAPYGTGPFKLSQATAVPDTVNSDIPLAPPGRFLKWANGALPSAYGQFPDAVLVIGVVNADRFPSASQCFVRWPPAGRPADFHPEFRDSWTPATIDGSEYWVLDNPLPIVAKEHKGNRWFNWNSDREDPSDEHEVFIGPRTPPPSFRLREYKIAPAERSDQPRRKITAHQPEVQVPVDPSISDTYRRALMEHEIHHTQQCNFWGPLMGALPLQGLLSFLYADIQEATGEENPGWINELERDAKGQPITRVDNRIPDNAEINPTQVVSIGGLMQLVWKYVILGPALPHDDARKAILALDYSDWNQVFNPLNRLITDAIPPVDPKSPAADRRLALLGQFFERALDLRSWTPFIGFVPLLLPDGAKSFIEQGASRASGDLYSTILSANDRFNHKRRILGVESKSERANLDLHVGDAVRLMLYAHYRTERLLRNAHGDRPGSPITYTDTADEQPRPLWLSVPNAGDSFLLPEELYFPAPAAGPLPPSPVPTLVELEGPAAGNAKFHLVDQRHTLLPRLRALVPTPPRVIRSLGIYLLAAGSGKLRADGYYASVGTDHDAETQWLVLNYGGEVKLDQENIAWQLPPAVSAVPPLPAPAAPVVLRRYLTESAQLALVDRAISGHVLRIDKPGGVEAISQRAGPDAAYWQLQLPTAVPATPVRLRIFRVFEAGDAAFDLVFDDVPTLKNVRSYLSAPVWLPVRDFQIDVQDLPAIADQTTFYDEATLIDTVIPLAAKERAFAIVSGGGYAAPKVERQGDNPPRGEKWRLAAFEKIPEDDVVLNVVLSYGLAPQKVDRPFKVTRQPRIRLTRPGGGAYEARKGTPLELDVAGGRGPYQPSADDLPAGTTLTMVNASRLAVTVNDAPALDATIVVELHDSGGLRGRRTVAIRH